MMSELTRLDSAGLSQLEEVIEKGLQTFVEVGNALMIIRDEKLYRDGYSTFEDYCRERWGMSKTHSNRMIQAAEVVNNVTPIGVTPQTESQARPLSSLEPEQQAEVWSKAVETAPNGKVTAKHVKDTVEKMTKTVEVSSPVIEDVPNVEFTVSPPAEPVESTTCHVCKKPMPYDEFSDICQRCNDRCFPEFTGVIHEVKCDLLPFYAITQGAKPFEIRKNDRDYQIGDKIIAKEWDQYNRVYTGQQMDGTIGFTIEGEYGLPSNYIVMTVDWGR